MYQVPELDRKEILKYLSTKPYIEVAPLIAMLAHGKRKKEKRMAKTNQTKFICPACFGNGYRKITQDASNPHLKVVISCEACNNQGEIVNNEKNIHALRYLNNML